MFKNCGDSATFAAPQTTISLRCGAPLGSTALLLPRTNRADHLQSGRPDPAGDALAGFRIQVHHGRSAIGGLGVSNQSILGDNENAPYRAMGVGSRIELEPPGAGDGHAHGRRKHRDLPGRCHRFPAMLGCKASPAKKAGPNRCGPDREHFGMASAQTSRSSAGRDHSDFTCSACGHRRRGLLPSSSPTASDAGR